MLLANFGFNVVFGWIQIHQIGPVPSTNIKHGQFLRMESLENNMRAVQTDPEFLIRDLALEKFQELRCF